MTNIDLKILAERVVRTQGNRFIKELLREKKIPIGTNKKSFLTNLNKAIDDGELSPEDFDTWFHKMEGWGNQHVYPFEISSDLEKELNLETIKSRVEKANLMDVWGGETLLTYPNADGGLQLTSIVHTGSILRMIWQEAALDWARTPQKDINKSEGLDDFQYRAYRKVSERTLNRFEADLEKGLAALFISSPFGNKDHKRNSDQALEDVKKLIDMEKFYKNAFDVSSISRNLDQKNIPNNKRPNPSVKTQKSRLSSGGSYVEFGSNSNERSLWKVSPILDVRKSIGKHQIERFQGTIGAFIFENDGSIQGLNRRIRIQLYGDQDRVWFRAGMTRDEVWAILEALKSYS